MFPLLAAHEREMPPVRREGWLAVEKALRDATRRMIRVRTTDTMSIPHDVIAKNSSGMATKIQGVKKSAPP